MSKKDDIHASKHIRLHEIFDKELKYFPYRKIIAMAVQLYMATISN